MIDALVVCGVHTQKQLRAWLRQQNIKTADVVSGARPVQAMAHHLRGDTGIEHDRAMGALLLEAVEMSITLHQPDRVVCFVARRLFDSAFVENFRRLADWLCSRHFNLPCSHHVMGGHIPSVRVLGLTCMDGRLNDALASIEPDDTGWMRLPGIEGRMADEGHRETLFAEMGLATQGGIMTRAVRVRMDPHADCAARALRHRKPEDDLHAWAERDRAIMREEHAAGHRFLRASNISCVNSTPDPVRCLARCDDGTFALRDY